MRKKYSLREIWKEDKIVWSAIMTIGILFFPTGFIHEAGHILVCVSNGFDYTFNIGDLVFNVYCSDSPQPIELYWALGGVFGMIGSLSLLTSKWVRANKGVFIGVVVTAFDHLQKAIFETTSHFSYLSNLTLLIFMGVLSLIILYGLLWHFGYRPYKKS
ncbi:MAG: hypothetical protein ACK4TO_00410 [Candidatus Nitrosotenuis sp.]